MKNSEHIAFIDACKGLGILSVLCYHSHIILYSCPLSEQNASNLIARLLFLFFLPLFFMASGYVGYRYKDNLREIFLWKSFSLLVPFLFFGLGYTLLSYYLNGVLQINLWEGFFTHLYNKGFWFLLVLFFIRFGFVLFSYFARKLGLKKDLFIFLLVFLVEYALAYIGIHWIGIASLDKVYDYLPFYLLGAFISKKSFLPVLQNRNILLWIAFAISLIVFLHIYFSVFHISARIWPVFQFLPTIFVFVQLSKLHPGTKLMCVLNYCGKRSLGIYVLHYFMFMYMPISFFKRIEYFNQPIILQFVLLLLGAILILLPTVLFVNLCNKNNFFYFLLNGRWKH